MDPTSGGGLPISEEFPVEGVWIGDEVSLQQRLETDGVPNALTTEEGSDSEDEGAEGYVEEQKVAENAVIVPDDSKEAVKPPEELMSFTSGVMHFARNETVQLKGLPSLVIRPPAPPLKCPPMDLNGILTARSFSYCSFPFISEAMLLRFLSANQELPTENVSVGEILPVMNQKITQNYATIFYLNFNEQALIFNNEYGRETTVKLIIYTKKGKTADKKTPSTAPSSSQPSTVAEVLSTAESVTSVLGSFVAEVANLSTLSTAESVTSVLGSQPSIVAANGELSVNPPDDALNDLASSQAATKVLLTNDPPLQTDVLVDSSLLGVNMTEPVAWSRGSSSDTVSTEATNDCSLESSDARVFLTSRADAMLINLEKIIPENASFQIDKTCDEEEEENAPATRVMEVSGESIPVRFENDLKRIKKDELEECAPLVKLEPVACLAVENHSPLLGSPQIPDVIDCLTPTVVVVAALSSDKPGVEKKPIQPKQPRFIVFEAYMTNPITEESIKLQREDMRQIFPPETPEAEIDRELVTSRAAIVKRINLSYETIIANKEFSPTKHQVKIQLRKAMKVKNTLSIVITLDITNTVEGQNPTKTIKKFDSVPACLKFMDPSLIPAPTPAPSTVTSPTDAVVVLLPFTTPNLPSTPIKIRPKERTKRKVDVISPSSKVKRPRVLGPGPEGLPIVVGSDQNGSLNTVNNVKIDLLVPQEVTDAHVKEFLFRFIHAIELAAQQMIAITDLTAPPIRLNKYRDCYDIEPVGVFTDEGKKTIQWCCPTSNLTSDMITSNKLVRHPSVPDHWMLGVTTHLDLLTEDVLQSTEHQTLKLLEEAKKTNLLRPRTFQKSAHRLKCFFGARYTWGTELGTKKNSLSAEQKQSLLRAHGIRMDVATPPTYTVAEVLPAFIARDIIKHQIVNQVAINIYEEGKEGLSAHKDDEVRFDLPVYSLRIFSDSRLSFGNRGPWAACNGQFSVPMPRNSALVLEHNSYASLCVKHGIRRKDMLGTSGVIIFRHIHDNLMMQALEIELEDTETKLKTLKVE